MTIEYLETSILYENPRPHIRSRHGYFPGLAVLPSGDLIALFVVSEAFESADATTYIARSGDLGKNWSLEGPLRALCSAGTAEVGSPDEQSGAGGNRSFSPPEHPEAGVPVSDYLKPSVIRNGTVIAIGYRFDRHDLEQGISVEETGGILSGDDIISFSVNEGKTWTRPQIILRSRPELYEISGPCIELQSGDLIAVAAPLKMPDGRNPSGQVGILLRSRDKGKKWTDNEIFFRAPAGNLTPFESRICEMQPGRLVSLVWAYDTFTDRHHPNHIAVSRDSGLTWTEPMNTGHWGQASNLIWLGGDHLMTIHAYRAADPGIYVRLVDFSGDRWKPVEEKIIYGAGAPLQTQPGQRMSEMFASIRFGQPSLLELPNGEILAAHWTVEDGQGKIRIHRLRVRGLAK
jgi:sialidase-1